MSRFTSGVMGFGATMLLATGFVVAQQIQPAEPGRPQTQPDRQAQPGAQQPGAQPGAQPGGQPGQRDLRQERDQQAGQPGRQQGRQQAGQQAGQQGGRQMTNPNDRILAGWLIVDNQAEIELARVAQQRAQSPQVREFAQKMIQDHTQDIEKLHQFVGHDLGDDQPGRQGRQQDRQQGQAGQLDRQQDRQQRQAGQLDRPQDRQQGQAGQLDRQQDRQARHQGQAGQQGRLDVVKLKNQLGERRIASMKRELEEKQGTEFDKCYAFATVMMHLEMVDTLTVFKEHASQDMQPILDETLRSTKEHLEHAKKMAQQLDGARAPATARRPGEAGRE